MKTLMHTLRVPLLVGLVMIPTLAGCQTRTHRSVVHHTHGRPYVVREVTTTTTKKAAPVTQTAATTQLTSVEQTVPPVESNPIRLSPAANEVVKLYESMVSEDVLVSFAHNSQYPFKLTADHIVYLQDIGVSDAVLNAMMQRDAYLTETPVDQVIAQEDLGNEELAVASNATAGQAPVYAENPPPATQPAPQTTVTETRVVTREYFHEQLAPYGSWVHVNDYGWCWRPTVAVTNIHWRPYSDNGRWVYTDNGWYWHSYYSWGWAPFHYGRWSRHNGYGWVWVPDTVWGPSWVTWRYSDAYCGWAPLPPRAVYRSGFGFTYHGNNVSVGFGFGLTYDHFHFVSRRNFTHHHVGRHRLGRDQAKSIYNRTTIVNNYNINSNNTIINNGISPERIATGTSQEIKRVPLKDVDSAEGVKLAGERNARQPRTLPVYRPKLPEQSKTVSPRILNKQQSRPALTRPNRDAEKIGLARNKETSRLQTSSANTVRPSMNRTTRSVGNRSSESSLKRPTASSSSSNQVRSSARPTRTTRNQSISSRPSTTNKSRSVSSSNRTEPRRPTYAQPSVSPRSSRSPQDSISYTPRPRTSSSRVSSSPRNVTPNVTSRPSIQNPSRSNVRTRQPEPSVTTRRPSTSSRTQQSPSISSRPTYSRPSVSQMAPRSTPQVRSRSVPAPRSTPSRSVSRPAPTSRGSSGSVSQRSLSRPPSSVPSFRSSAPATRSRPSGSSSSSSSGSSSSSSGASSSSSPSRPGR